MNDFGHPLLVFSVSIGVLWVSAWIASSVVKRRQNLEEEAREDFGVIPGVADVARAAVGFSFSMATGRYDQRKNYEEAEANAIGTEVVRAGLLPPAPAPRRGAHTA